MSLRVSSSLRAEESDTNQITPRGISLHNQSQGECQGYEEMPCGYGARLEDVMAKANMSISPKKKEEG